MKIEKFKKFALRQMRRSEIPDLRFLMDTWIACNANPTPKDRKDVLNHFWSVVLFETWADAKAKIKNIPWWGWGSPGKTDK